MNNKVSSKSITLAQIAKIAKGRIIGDKNCVIKGFSSIEEAKEGDLTFLSHPKYLPFAHKTKARAVIVPRGTELPGKPVIQTDNPSLAFAKIVAYSTDNRFQLKKGIHKTAIVAKDAKVGKNAAIGPYVVIESKAKIGDDTVVGSGSYIGHETVIGKNCLIYPHVTVRERIQIGNRVIIHSGTVIGSDGFGFEAADGVHQKIPQIGTVVIEDDVEIGANVTIDRARIDKTIIGRGTKIDNLVQIAHNVIVGENCIIVSQVGISGSTTIGRGSILAGQAGIVGHIEIGEGSIVYAKSGISKSLPPSSRVFGYPAQPLNEFKKIHASLNRLPRYVKLIQELNKRIEDLEAKLDLKPKI